MKHDVIHDVIMIQIIDNDISKYSIVLFFILHTIIVLPDIENLKSWYVES